MKLSKASKDEILNEFQKELERKIVAWLDRVNEQLPVQLWSPEGLVKICPKPKRYPADCPCGIAASMCTYHCESGT
jgi:hypothetical protein